MAIFNESLSEPEPMICAFYNPDFIIWSSVGSFYIPCLIMIVLYYKIFQVEIMKKVPVLHFHISFLSKYSKDWNFSIAEGDNKGLCKSR